MRLIHKDFEFIFELHENKKSLFVIEHPETYRKLVQDLILGTDNEECGFVLSHNNTPIKIKDNLCFIMNPFVLSLNERKLLNKLYDVLKREIQSSELLLENNMIYSHVEQYALEIIKLSDWELLYEETMDVQNLLKFMNIRFAEYQDSMLEKITDYIKVVHDLLGISLFVFTHLLSCLNGYEIEKLYEYVQYQKINILLIESQQPENIDFFDSVIIIDKDCCEIDLDV
jgi:CRISPR type II-A-associated protein Csn2